MRKKLKPKSLTPKATRLLHLPRTLRPPSNLGLDGDDDTDYSEELDLQVGYRRSIPIVTEPEVEIDDYVRTRLWLARQLAVAKHQEVWG